MKRPAESVANTLAVGVCGLLVATIVLQTVSRHRSATRSIQCKNNLKQIGLAIHNYHSAYKTLPAAYNGTDGGTDRQSNQRRLGPLVALLPFMEQQALWEQISNPLVTSDAANPFPPMGPAPWFDANMYPPWARSPQSYSCPDDLNSSGDKEPQKQIVVTTLAMPPSPLGISPLTLANYVACFGDGTLELGSPGQPANGGAAASRSLSRYAAVYRTRAQDRGIFQAGRALKFRDCLDGLSNIVMFSETIASPNHNPRIAGGIDGLSKNPSQCLATRDQEGLDWLDVTRGSRWCDGALAISGFQTVLPPNSPSCSSNLEIDDVIVSASSLHAGGVYVLLGDGAVGFVTDSIDCGDVTSPGVASEPGYVSAGSQSPYGVWGAIGSRASGEVIEEVMDDGIFESESSPSLFGGLRRSQGRSQPDSMAGFRRWTDRDGGVTLLAKLNRIIDKETAELEDQSGILHRVPLNSLSDQDIWLAVRMEIQKQASESGAGTDQ